MAGSPDLIRPTRIVDAHVHLWDPARTDWYPYLAHPPTEGPGDAAQMYRRFDLEIYRRETAGWNVDKIVNVAAATGRHSIDETVELDRTADANGGPDAIIGGLPPTDSVREAIELLDRQMTASRFRGVRPMGIHEGPVPHPEVLDALAERNLIFELMAHTDQLRTAASTLEGYDDLVVVVEHTGWPRSGSAEELQLWRDGIDALAALGENVICKLSGLAMPLGTMDADVFAPWIEHALEVFGVDRCLFASNFPVDGMHGTFDDLYTTFATLAAGFDDDARDKLFATNTERLYRC
jgi:predicted TIM-barrel fold metal-dependent hydrolase